MKEVDPKSTSRALAFELWMKAPMPMVTLMKTLDVTPLVRMSRKRGYKFNMLLCWCIGKAAERERLEKLIRSVKDTIGAEERKEFMSDEQKFEAFKQRAVAHNEEAYGAEIRAKYGDKEVDEANAAVMNLTQEQYREWKDLGQEIQERLEAAVEGNMSPESEEGKELCVLHRRWLTITGNRYDPARHRGIAELYVMDERFTAYYDKQVPGCARFLRDAVIHWAK